jgi:hypothetical protein
MKMRRAIENRLDCRRASEYQGLRSTYTNEYSSTNPLSIHDSLYGTLRRESFSFVADDPVGKERRTLADKPGVAARK